MKRTLDTILIALLLCSLLDAEAQMSVPKIDCFKNLTDFMYYPPSGVTINSIKWLYGDGSSSTNNPQKYIYKAPGTYQVKLQVKLSNNTTVLDSQSITIYPLPKASFYLMSKTDSCINSNNICYVDTSQAGGANQKITKRLMIWGDGVNNLFNSPAYSDIVCHHYLYPDKYKITMELTDNYGCKNSTIAYINVLEQSRASFDVSSTFKDCNTKQVCISNTSTGKNIGKSIHTWKIDNGAPDTNKYLTNRHCDLYKTSKFTSAKLWIRDANGCRDSVEKFYDILIDPLPTNIKLDDSVSCYKYTNIKLVSASIKSTAFELISWKIDNGSLMTTNNTLFQFTPLNFSLKPGKHMIYCYIVRGSCTTTLSHSFTLKGPIAHMEILDNNQCNTNRPVFFKDSSWYVDHQHTIYKWTIYDPSAGNCTTYRAKNINRDKNCIYTLDSVAVHRFPLGGGPYTVKLWVKDTLSGCTDSTTQTVSMKSCCPLLKEDSVVYCVGEYFTRATPAFAPKYVTLDSGKTWKKFPTLLNYKSGGVFDVGFIFETLMPEWGQIVGNDTLKFHQDTFIHRDTIFKKAFLRLYPYKRDTITYSLRGQCRPFTLTVYFKNGYFSKGETLEIDWDDKGNFYYQKFDTATHIDSVSYIYNNSTFLDGQVKTILKGLGGCETTYIYHKSAGRSIATSAAPYYCKSGSSILFLPYIIDKSTGSSWTEGQAGTNIWWKFSDTNTIFNQFKLYHKFKGPGQHSYTMIVSGPPGCQDSITGSIFFQDLRAGVMHTSKEVFCSQLKQFFDSTTMIKDSLDHITNYNWDFGTGKFTNPIKDPFKSFNTSAESIPVVHTVMTSKGCTDTVRFDLRIKGAHPYFTIADTIGCDSLYAVFNNLSNGCKGYIWEFGDENQTNYWTGNAEQVKFDYLKPGRYSIRLNGYDTIYNPATNAKYYCSNYFPDNVYQKDTVRSVVVLPTRKTGIIGLDTICLGTKIELQSYSDPLYDYDLWQMGDDTMRIAQVSTGIKYFYAKTGTYRVQLKPFYKTLAYNQCRDSASKIITVLGVNADFDIDPGKKPPIFLFHNKSMPSYASLYWDFGQPNLGAYNYSTENDPLHTYGYDTGHFKTCLIAKLPFGCADTTCKDAVNDRLADLVMYNVFTPGNADGKNDAYDVQIEGESYYHLRIYDRWGVLVFESSEDSDNIAGGNWNGKVMNKGNDCPSGTYYYLFEYRMKSGNVDLRTIEGTVTLIR